jgi:hypothetical protein
MRRNRIMPVSIWLGERLIEVVADHTEPTPSFTVDARSGEDMVK